MKIKAVLFLILSFFVTVASAGSGGSESGNGGSSIVCQDGVGKITSVELLDFYEARTQRGIKVDLGPMQDSVDQKLALVVLRLRRFDELLSNELRAEIKNFAANSRFLTGIRLVEIPDSQNLFIPSGCQQEQIAVWREPAVPEDRRYNVNQDLWERLDNDNKAGLILHEVLYYIAQRNHGANGLSDSRMIRYMVSKLASSDTGSWSLRDYVDFLRKLDFKRFWYKNYSFVVDDFFPQFWVNGSLMGGPLAVSTRVQLQGTDVEVKDLRLNANGELYQIIPEVPVLLKADGQSIWFQNDLPMTIEKANIVDGYAMPGNKNVFQRTGAYELKVAGALRNKAVHLSFKADGTLMFCNACEGSVQIAGQVIAVSVPDSYNNSDFAPASFYRWNPERSEPEGVSLFLASPTSFQVGSDKVRFRGQFWCDFNTGQVKKGTFAQPSPLTIGTKKVKFTNGEVQFYQSGGIEYGVLAEDTTLPAMDGTNILYLTGMRLWFDEESGRVRSTLPISPEK